MAQSNAQIEARIKGRKHAETVLQEIQSLQIKNKQEYKEAFLVTIKEKLGVLPQNKVEELPFEKLENLRIPFGKHKNQKFQDVPMEYLDWLCGEQEGFYRELRRYINHPENTRKLKV